jgi:hypothetical protein
MLQARVMDYTAPPILQFLTTALLLLLLLLLLPPAAYGFSVFFLWGLLAFTQTLLSLEQECTS